MLWALNYKQSRLVHRSLLSQLKSALKSPKQKPNTITWSQSKRLLFAPASNLSDMPLAAFFTTGRIRAALAGNKVSICRHMRCSDEYVAKCFVPSPAPVNRDECLGSTHHPCACYSSSDTSWGLTYNWCPEESCGAAFRFFVDHSDTVPKPLAITQPRKAVRRELTPGERINGPPDVLYIQFLWTWEKLEEGTHPSRTGCLTPGDRIAEQADAMRAARQREAENLTLSES